MTSPISRTEYDDELLGDRPRPRTSRGATGRGPEQPSRQAGSRCTSVAAQGCPAVQQGRAGLPPGRAGSRASATRSRQGHLDPGRSLDRYQGRSPGKDILPGAPRIWAGIWPDHDQVVCVSSDSTIFRAHNRGVRNNNNRVPVLQGVGALCQHRGNRNCKAHCRQWGCQPHCLQTLLGA